MSLFTVIIGSAHGDDTETNYLVDAVDPKTACAYALRIAEAHRDRRLSALRCMEGEVKFCPTIFDNPANALEGYIPEVIDLRPPVAPRMSRWATAHVSLVAGRKMVKWFASRSLLSKVEKDGSVHKFMLLVPVRLGDEKAAEYIQTAYGDTFPRPISTDNERAVQVLHVEHVELESED